MKKLNQTYFTIAVYALAVIAFSLAFLMLCINLRMITSALTSFLSAISAILYGILFAFLLFPAVKRFDILYTRLFCQKKPHPFWASGFSIASALLIALGLITALLVVIIPRLIDDAWELYRFILVTKARLDDFVAQNVTEHPMLYDLYETISSLLFGTSDSGAFVDSLVTSLSELLSVVVGQVSSISMGLIIAVYLLASRRIISGIIGKFVVAIIPERHVNRFVLFFKRLYTDFASFSFHRLIIAFFFGSMTLLLCLLLRVPLLSVIVLLALLSHLIPVIGPIIGTAGSVLLVTILKGTWWGIFYAVIILALEFFMTRVLLPHLLPRKLRPPFALAATVVLLFYALFGIIGAFAAVPVYSTLNIEFRRFLVHRLAKKNLPVSAEAYQTFSSADYEKAAEELSARKKAEAENDDTSDNVQE